MNSNPKQPGGRKGKGIRSSAPSEPLADMVAPTAEVSGAMPSAVVQDGPLPGAATVEVENANAGATEPAPIDRSATLRWIIFGLLLVLGLWAYWPNIQEMVSIWESEPDYSHGYLVLPFALMLLWLRSDLCPKEMPQAAVVGGVMLAALAFATRVAGVRLFFSPIDNWSLLIWLSACVLAIWGWRYLFWSFPSIFFLWFAMPLPFRIEVLMRQPLQRLATQLSSAVLVALGQPALAEGNAIRIEDHVFGVNEACAGLRIFFGIAALAFGIAIVSRRSWLVRGLLILSILPVALTANVTRIVATCLLFKRIGEEASQKFAHDTAGLVMIPYAAVLLGIVLWLLGKAFREVQVVKSTTLFRSAAPGGGAQYKEG